MVQEQRLVHGEYVGHPDRHPDRHPHLRSPLLELAGCWLHSAEAEALLWTQHHPKLTHSFVLTLALWALGLSTEREL